MDNLKHMVTIPIADYQELIERKELAGDKRDMFKFIQSHFDMLRGKGFAFGGDTRFDKMPMDIVLEKQFNQHGELYTIHFKY